jgi:superfamily II DNA or RNA helicase
MSVKVNMENLSNETREKINIDLTIELGKDKYNSLGPKKFIQPYSLINNDVILPFAYGCRELKLPRPDRFKFSSVNLVFNGKLRDEQVEVKDIALKILKTGSVIISAWPGFGKTLLSIYLSTVIKLKTLIIVNKIVLMKQWEDSIVKLCPDALVQKLTAKSDIKDADFYIINAINLPKIKNKFFDNIGTVIVDEVHLILAQTLSKSLQMVFPRYLIGLSATPFRYDDLDCLFDIYFGKDKIIRKMEREHIVYKLYTSFTPEMRKTENGRLDWGHILDAQAKDVERNQLMLNIIKHFKDRNFLVIVKRVHQGQYLMKKLVEMGENVSDLMGEKQIFDKSARILIGTIQKVGVGFDHDKLDTLMLACDSAAYYSQLMGRVFRRKDTNPIIFDLIDNNFVLKKHYKIREEDYLSAGAIIKTLDIKKFI